MPEFSRPRRKKKAKPAKKPKAPVLKTAEKKKKSSKEAKKESPKTLHKASKKQKRSNQRRKQNMAIYYVMFFILSVAVFSILSVTVLFNLEEILTDGDSIYSSDAIIDAADIKTGINLLRLNTDDCRNRILNSLFYIDDVKISKKLPNKLVISVVGATEMANIECMGQYYVVSKRGRVLNIASNNSPNTVVFGYEADEPQIGDYLKSENERKQDLVFLIFEAIEKTELDGIVSIDISDYMKITMNYMDRITLIIGPETELEEKLRAAAELLLQNDIEENERGVLRLTDPLIPSFLPDETPEPEITLPEQTETQPSSE